MEELVLNRLSAKGRSPTVGVLTHQGVVSLLTLELPWADNKPNISCIPDGKYLCKLRLGATTSGGMFIPRTFEVTNVPDRGGVLFHVGNTIRDTHGCILLGLGLGDILGQQAVILSRDAFSKFLNLMVGEEEFSLTVAWV